MNPDDAKITLVAEDRPGLAEKAAQAWGEQVEPEHASKIGSLVIVRVDESRQINGLLGNTLVLGYSKDGGFYGVWTYANGQISPGDGIGPENCGPVQ
jgi:hypothetical protein